MGFVDDLKQLLPKPPPKVCTVAWTLDTMPADDAAALLEALGDETKHAADLARVLAAHGYQLSATTIRRHRKKDCACEPR